MAAKIMGDALETMRAAIAPLDTPAVRARYIARDFPRADAVRDLTRRYRFDLFYAAGGWRILPDDDSITDAHIETALRTIVPSLGV